VAEIFARRMLVFALVAGCVSCAPARSSDLDRVPRRAGGAPAVEGSTWFGYVARAGASPFDAVRGRWVEPAFACGSSSSAAIWVGLDGFGNDTVEQIGTEADCRGGVAIHSAWLQRYPDDAIELEMRIRPGDVMAARVVVADGVISLRLRNRSSGTSFATTIAAAAEGTSAEWVVEAPSSCRDGRCTVRPLTPFGRVAFARCAVRVGGEWRSAGDADAFAMRGAVGGVAASPTSLVSPSAFDVASDVR
jgi:hypothetical protein